MPFGYLIGTAILGLCALAALAPPRRPQPVAGAAYYLGLVFNEVPYVALAWLAVSTALAAADPGLGNWVGILGLALAVATALGFLAIARRARLAAPALEAALEADLGAAAPAAIARARRRRSRVRPIVFPPPLRSPRVKRHANLSYGDAGRRNLLDLYRPRGEDAADRRPALVYFHGGRFRSGHKHREAMPLLHRLAARGWVCISANYRLSPHARFPDHHADAKRVVAWAREHRAEHGIDPDRIVAAGGSAGAHMAAMLALTPGEPALQPGFEAADASVAAAICLYGYYGGMGTPSPISSSPADHATPDAPPFLIVHGDRDTLVPAARARSFAGTLRDAGAKPVVYAELPGALHSFDLFHSIREEAVVDAAEAFLTTAIAPPSIADGSGRSTVS